MPGRRADRRVSQSDFYQSFSTRLRILLLDARAGTPPSTPQFILCRGSDPTRLEQRLASACRDDPGADAERDPKGQIAFEEGHQKTPNGRTCSAGRRRRPLSLCSEHSTLASLS